MPIYTGLVVQGKQEARTLGYPTANLEYETSNPPEAGVWVCRVTVDQESKTLAGLAVIGMWSLANGLPSLEIHLLDTKIDLYGHHLRVTLLQKLRDLETFSQLDDLIAKIQTDIENARKLF